VSCIAGTVEKPKKWIRFVASEAVEVEGRWCDRTQPFTNRRACSSCPAYRGVRWDGSLATGVAPNGDPVGLSPQEYDAWQVAQDAALIDDDFGPIGLFADQMTGIGVRSLARIGEPEAQATQARYMRGWREANPERAKELNRLHAKAYRDRKRASVSSAETSQTDGVTV
jgi:hypothetical protein